jgi:endoglycosylceramidase
MAAPPERRPPQLAVVGLALAALLAGACAWACAPIGSLTTRVPPADRGPPAGGLPWLHATADRIVDPTGRTVLLRGFNDDALLDWPRLAPAPLDESDAALIQASGFNLVRLPIAWSRLEPVRGRVDHGYLEQVAATVDLLNRHDLYVVLDMHFSLGWSPRFGGSGAPTWAVVPRVPALGWLPPGPAWWPNLSPAVVAAEGYFWLSNDWQADFELVWRAVAARFRDDSGVVGYDLYNEPHPFPLPPPAFARHWLWPFYARTIDRIGAADPNHLFVVEEAVLLDAPTPIVPLQAPDLVYSPHVYTGSLVPPAFTAAPQRLSGHIRDEAGRARALGAPLWVGEFGIDRQKSHAHQWTETALDALDDLQVGWAWWQWRQDEHWGIRDRAGRLDRDFLRLLARPYAAAAPAGVRAGRGDGLQGRLELDVAAGHADLPLSVAWSALTLPPPQADGSCVRQARWDPERARLEIDLVPGAGCQVRVVPEAGSPSPARSD